MQCDINHIDSHARDFSDTRIIKAIYLRRIPCMQPVVQKHTPVCHKLAEYRNAQIVPRNKTPCGERVNEILIPKSQLKKKKEKFIGHI